MRYMLKPQNGTLKQVTGHQYQHRHRSPIWKAAQYCAKEEKEKKKKKEDKLHSLRTQNTFNKRYLCSRWCSIFNANIEKKVAFVVFSFVFFYLQCLPNLSIRCHNIGYFISSYHFSCLVFCLVILIILTRKLIAKNSKTTEFQHLWFEWKE